MTCGSGSRRPARRSRRPPASTSAGTSSRRARPTVRSSGSTVVLPETTTDRRSSRRPRSTCACTGSRRSRPRWPGCATSSTRRAGPNATDPSVPTTGLPKVLSFTASLRAMPDHGRSRHRLPDPPPRGLVPRRGRQGRAEGPGVPPGDRRVGLGGRPVGSDSRLGQRRRARPGDPGRRGPGRRRVFARPDRLERPARRRHAGRSRAIRGRVGRLAGGTAVADPDRPCAERARPPRPVRHRPERRHLSRRVVEGAVPPGAMAGGRSCRPIGPSTGATIRSRRGASCAGASTAGSRPRSTSGSSCP